MIGELQQLWDTYVQAPRNRYRLVARLENHKGPINCLAFTGDGSLLASGGDDETVKIWSLETMTCRQVIHDRNTTWGQITCMKWLALDASKTLCFGTGRGLILIYGGSKFEARTLESSQLVELTNIRAAPASDSIEALAYDHGHSRLAMTSHYGEIKLYEVEKNGTLRELWRKSITNAIPRAIHFLDGSQTIAYFALETGEMTMRAAEKLEPDERVKILKSAVGNAAICPRGKYLLIDNLSNGFDVYHIPRTSPDLSLIIPTKRRFIKQGVFAEKGTHMVCGSDHGKAYIFGFEHEKYLQKLHHTSDVLLQTVDAVTTMENHIIATASSTEQSDICIWIKPQSINNAARKESPGQTIVNMLILMLLLWWISSYYMLWEKATYALDGLWPYPRNGGENLRGEDTFVQSLKQMLRSAGLDENVVDGMGPLWPVDENRLCPDGECFDDLL